MRDADGALPGTPVASPSLRHAIVPGILLLGVFAGVELWFGAFQYYTRDFFTPGWLGLVNNLARIAFLGVLFWLVYAPGHALIVMIGPAAKPSPRPLAERMLLGFGAGIGLWHAVMLVLGVAGLYTRPILAGLAAVILVASARHFAGVTTELYSRLATGWRRLRRGAWSVGMVGGIAVAVALAWVLLARGLYPGGSGDYYTHYFPYYAAVLRDHGLAPNDVWYHYFYSKGDGLFFLAMVLSDPLAPSLATTSCVIPAAIALLALGQRLAPRSLWPAAGALIYLLYLLVGFGYGGSDEFQKDHELASALMLLAVWAFAMRRLSGDRAYLMAAIGCTVAASIVTQPVGVLLGAGMAAWAVWALVSRQWQYWRDSMVVGAAAGLTLVAVFVLSYVVVGLVTDQPLDLALQFADTHRLDRLGLLPVLVATAWTRYNYAAVSPPFGMQSLIQAVQYLRLELLWVCFGALIAVVVVRLVTETGRRAIAVPDRTGAADPACHAAGLVMRMLAIALGALVAVSVVAGRVQTISYLRFSTFFVPLVLLFAIACWGRELARARNAWWDRSLRLGMPVLVLAGVIVSWCSMGNWFTHVREVTADSARFLVGRYSLRAAYTHQAQAYGFDGVNAESLAAAQQLAPDTPIWSTNVMSAICMAPGCRIESVISYRFSGQLDQILTAPPDTAQRLLREAGLDYFLVSTQSPLLDILPYSRLFAPDTIDRYLGVKWSDGKTYLLTWLGPDTNRLGPEFLTAYRQLVDAPTHPWFRFRELVPWMGPAVDMLRSRSGFGQPVHWPWLQGAPESIRVLNATYGASCRRFSPAALLQTGIATGDETSLVQEDCRTGKVCSFVVDVQHMSDPAPGCAKDFSISYECPMTGRSVTIRLPAEANGKRVTLDCSDTR